MPRGGEGDPKVCPKCKSPYWNNPKKPMMSYGDFQAAIKQVLAVADGPLTWTEIRTTAKLPQMFPNNQWVHRLEKEIGLVRDRDAHGIIHWRLK